ncbi:unnamed protein product [Darwinula stevensoni]|uniref:RRM domain-containing protein n=1 Tax=Darwinula stevensoni TaxID=69355 RepID=A0A7R9A6D9_9CRUS|nr:unnamed protein product [Darwinula stevensoni]CAG0894233.1 unnamed protein product [Darwinula stevensoni]
MKASFSSSVSKYNSNGRIKDMHHQCHIMDENVEFSLPHMSQEATMLSMEDISKLDKENLTSESMPEWEENLGLHLFQSAENSPFDFGLETEMKSPTARPVEAAPCTPVKAARSAPVDSDSIVIVSQSGNSLWVISPRHALQQRSAAKGWEKKPNRKLTMHAPNNKTLLYGGKQTFASMQNQPRMVSILNKSHAAASAQQPRVDTAGKTRVIRHRKERPLHMKSLGSAQAYQKPNPEFCALGKNDEEDFVSALLQCENPSWPDFPGDDKLTCDLDFMGNGYDSFVMNGIESTLGLADVFPDVELITEGDSSEDMFKDAIQNLDLPLNPPTPPEENELNMCAMNDSQHAPGEFADRATVEVTRALQELTGYSDFPELDGTSIFSLTPFEKRIQAIEPHVIANDILTLQVPDGFLSLHQSTAILDAGEGGQYDMGKVLEGTVACVSSSKNIEGSVSQSQGVVSVIDQEIGTETLVFSGKNMEGSASRSQVNTVNNAEDFFLMVEAEVEVEDLPSELVPISTIGNSSIAVINSTLSVKESCESDCSRTSQANEVPEVEVKEENLPLEENVPVSSIVFNCKEMEALCDSIDKDDLVKEVVAAIPCEAKELGNGFIDDHDLKDFPIHTVLTPPASNEVSRSPLEELGNSSSFMENGKENLPAGSSTSGKKKLNLQQYRERKQKGIKASGAKSDHNSSPAKNRATAQNESNVEVVAPKPEPLQLKQETQSITPEHENARNADCLAVKRELPRQRSLPRSYQRPICKEKVFQASIFSLFVPVKVSIDETCALYNGWTGVEPTLVVPQGQILYMEQGQDLYLCLQIVQDAVLDMDQSPREDQFLDLGLLTKVTEENLSLWGHGNIDRKTYGRVEERRVIYVGGVRDGLTRSELRERFAVFGPIEDVSIHFRDYGDNYGFVTFCHCRDAVAAIEHGNDDPTLPRYDITFGGRREFCGKSYADLDAMEEYDPMNMPASALPLQHSSCGYYPPAKMDFDTLLFTFRRLKGP